LTSAKDSIIPEFTEKLSLFNLNGDYNVNSDRIEAVSGKGKIIFKGIKTSAGNQSAKLKSLKDFSIFVLDEAEEENDEKSFEKISLSIRANDLPNYCILILNPTSKAHWIYKRFFEAAGVMEGFNGVKGNVCYIHTTYLDCLKYVPSDYIFEVEAMKRTNPEKYNHIMLGGWLEQAEGVILKNWEFGEFDEALSYGYGMDFGFFPDPDVLVKVAIDKKNRLIYVKEEIGENSLKPHELKELTKKIVGNSFVVADSAEPRLIADIKSAGVNILPVNKISVIEGLKILQDYKIVVHPSSTKIAFEFNNYVMKNGEPVDCFNHRIDAIRYYAITKIRAFEKPNTGNRVGFYKGIYK
jgi:phage terminase large subunit